LDSYRKMEAATGALKMWEWKMRHGIAGEVEMQEWNLREGIVFA